MISPFDSLDVQMALSRYTRLRVDTHKLAEYEVQYRIGYKYLLTLDEDDFDKLSAETESAYQFQQVFKSLSKSCVTLPDFLRSR